MNRNWPRGIHLYVVEKAPDMAPGVAHGMGHAPAEDRAVDRVADRFDLEQRGNGD